MHEIFEPETAARQRGEWRILLLDGYESHLSCVMLDFVEKKKILLVCLPAHSTHLLQPLDVGLFGLLQHAYTAEVGKLAEVGINYINKVMFLEILAKARVQALTKRNARGAWRGAGIKPYNP